MPATAIYIFIHCNQARLPSKHLCCPVIQSSWCAAPSSEITNPSPMRATISADQLEESKASDRMSVVWQRRLRVRDTVSHRLEVRPVRGVLARDSSSNASSNACVDGNNNNNDDDDDTESCINDRSPPAPVTLRVPQTLRVTGRLLVRSCGLCGLAPISTHP